MAVTTPTSRTAHLVELMTMGDDAFNVRDWATVDAVHDPNMVAYITGLAQPIYGSEAHSAAMQQFLRSFPDMHVTPPTRSSSEAETGSPSSPTSPGPSPAR